MAASPSTRADRYVSRPPVVSPFTVRPPALHDGVSPFSSRCRVRGVRRPLTCVHHPPNPYRRHLFRKDTNHARSNQFIPQNFQATLRAGGGGDHRRPDWRSAGGQPSLPGLVFGSPGQAWGIDGPGRVAVDAAGNIYVIDIGNARVQVFDPSGVPFLVFGWYGSLPGQFDLPTDIVVAANGSIYVADSGNLRVQRFTPSGTHDLSFGTPGQGPGQFFNRVMSLALDASGNVYVGSVFQLQKFAPDGTLLRVISSEESCRRRWPSPGTATS